MSHGGGDFWERAKREREQTPEERVAAWEPPDDPNQVHCPWCGAGSRWEPQAELWDLTQRYVVHGVTACCNKPIFISHKLVPRSSTKWAIKVFRERHLFGKKIELTRR